VTTLAGAELGGIPLVAAASIASGLPCVFIRNRKKDYGTAKQLEGTLEPGARVVIVEDVATTGGQVLEAAQTIRDAGAEIVAIICTIDRQEGARENIEQAGYVFDALFTVQDLGIREETKRRRDEETE
jgi:orotate phosphoribosyltransferase